MFARRYYGGAYFGPSYFGEGEDAGAILEWPASRQGRGAGSSGHVPVSMQGTAGNDHAMQRSKQGTDPGASTS